ncbi:unnamed protein product [Dibothriocephalus latus]|uniref:Uncharacterized protein n=1 Tax=Dibothriocephalus latus TaxID=60516 RepID=A0A3P7LDD4_DIBLA|nr:unnamed protein product [Dibothriocephalus latus]
MDFAPYVNFDELYEKYDQFKQLASTHVLTIRLLGIISAFDPQNNEVEILSPLQMDAHPCVLVDVSLLAEDLKTSLAGEGAQDRLVQFIGTLKVVPGGKSWRLQAFILTFMDGIDLNAYQEVVKITRPYATMINF